MASQVQTGCNLVVWGDRDRGIVGRVDVLGPKKKVLKFTMTRMGLIGTITSAFLTPNIAHGLALSKSTASVHPKVSAGPSKSFQALPSGSRAALAWLCCSQQAPPPRRPRASPWEDAPVRMGCILNS